MDGYAALKSLHIIGVVLFVGNIVVTGWWKVMADRTGDPRVIAFAQRQVTLTDWVFTAGGVLMILAGGIGNLVIHGMTPTPPWAVLGEILFIASGVIWAAVLIPVQVRQARMATTFADGGPIPPEYWNLCRLWTWFGILATILPLAVIPVMVFKAG